MAKMTHCKSCGAEIAKDAKTCPHCGSRNKKGHGFLKFLLLLILAGGAWSYYQGGVRSLNQLQYQISGLLGSSTGSHSSASANTADSVSSEGVTPELKEFLDSYESFIDEYCAFMEKYNAGKTDTSDLLEYTSLLEKEADFAQKSDADENDEIPNPIINSKYQETIFQKVFHASAEDIGNTSYDAAIRKENADILKKSLSNLIMFRGNPNDCPMFVPICIDESKRDGLREELINNNIFCPIHWPISQFHTLKPSEQFLYENKTE